MSKKDKFTTAGGLLAIFLASILFLSFGEAGAESLPKRNIDHSRLAEGVSGPKSPVSPSRTGAATYSYPIDLPEFHFPFSLSLDYTSASPADPGGELGAGWRLSLPEIVRDIRGTPEDPSDDWFYYEGQRLLPIGNNQYQTVQSDPGRRFVLVEGQRWEVTSPDGTKMVFPWPTLFPGQDYPVKWRLGWIEDKLGNTVYIHYLPHSDPRVASQYTDYRPQMIGYSGQPYGDVVVRVSIEDKPLQPGGAEEYLLTHERPIPYRIKEIWVGRSDYGGTRREQRARYVIQYEQSRVTWGRSRIKRISHYGSDDAAKPRVTEFTYGGPNPSGISGGELLNYAYQGFDVHNVIGHHTGDFNLDGVTDYVTWEASGNIKFVDGNDACVNEDNFCPAPISAEPWLHISAGWHPNGRGGWSRTPDINGDGRPDLAIITSAYAPGGVLNPRKIYFWLNGTVLGQGLYGPGILNDSPYPNFNPTVDAAGEYSDEFSFVDLNGDGRPDLLWIGVNGAFARWARSRYPENFSPQQLSSGSFDKFSDLTGFNYNFRSLVGDFNGDGRVDFLTGNYVYLSQVNVGNRFTSQPWNYDLSGRDRRRLMVADVDQDGFDDLVWFTGREKDYGCQIRVDVARNTGRGFAAFETWGQTWVGGLRAQAICEAIHQYSPAQPNLSVRDEDNDGDLDFVIIGPNSDAAWQIILYNSFANGNTNQDLLTQIQLPTGGTIRLQYKQAPSAWGGGLTPERPLRAGPLGYRPVLSSVTVYDGLGTTGKMTYSYANGYYDVITKEFHGFEKVTQTFSDGTAQSIRYHVIHRDFFERYDGWIGNVADEVFTGEDGRIYRWNIFDYEVTQDPGTKVFTTRLKEKLVGTCHQDNPYDCLSSKTAFQWTDYGAMKQTDHYGYDGKIRRSKVYRYAENKEDWIVDKPFEKSTYDSTGQLLVRESYGYDDQDPGVPPKKGLLTKKIVEDMTVQGLRLQGSSPVATTSYEYDPYGNRTKEVSPEGHITTWDYSGNAYLFPYTKTVHVGGKTLTTITLYDLVLGKLKSERDPNGHTTDYRYENFGRLKKIIRPGDTEDSPTVLLSYFDDPVPKYVERTIKLDGGKQTIQREYRDGLGRFIGRLTGELDGKWVYSELTTYDGNGRKKIVWEPFFNTSTVYRQTTYTYRDNKVSSIRHPDGTETSYYYLKNGVRITDERGMVTEQIRDAFGNLLQATLDKDGPKEQTTFYQYDALDHLIQSKDPRGLVTQYKYDAYGRIRGLNAPDTSFSKRNGFQVWYDYDGDGNQTHIWKGLEVIKNEYDALGRLKKSSTSRNGGYSYTPEVVNAYDDPSLSKNSLGRLAKSQLASGKVWYRYDYDKRGRVENQEVWLDGNQFSMRYTYDSADHLLSLTDPRGKRVQYTYNRLGQLNTAGDETAIAYDGKTVIKTFDYNPQGQVTDIHYGHGLHLQYAYNARGWMTAMKDAGSPEIFKIDYDEYDPTGNLRHVKGRLSNYLFDYTYTYDAHHRLENVSGISGTRTLQLGFKYDDSGNIIEKTELDGTQSIYTIVPGTNRLDTITPSDRRFYYNGHGNLTYIVKSGVLEASFGYDLRQRLVSFYRNGQSGQYLYDPMGRKVMATVGGQTTYYVYDPFGQLLATKEASNGWATFIYGNGQRLARVGNSGNLQYFHNDYLGSARLISEGPPFSVVWSQDYLPYGERLAGDPGGNDFAFTGKEREESSGLYDYGARWYDPSLGRFIQLDSYWGDVSQPQTLNRYSYVLNNPLRYVDPTGNQPEKPRWQRLMDTKWGWGPSPAEMWEQLRQSAPSDRTSVDQKLEKVEVKRHPAWSDLDQAAWSRLDCAVRKIDFSLSHWDQLSREEKNRLQYDIYLLGQILEKQSEYNWAQGRSLAHPQAWAVFERYPLLESFRNRAQAGVNQDLLRVWRQWGWTVVVPHYLNLMRGVWGVPAGFPPGTPFRKYEPPPPIIRTEQLY